MKHYYLLEYDSLAKKWAWGAEVERERFPDGTLYDDREHKWLRGQDREGLNESDIKVGKKAFMGVRFLNWKEDTDNYGTISG